MKNVSVVLLLILLAPVLLFAINGSINVFSADGSTAVGNYFFDTFNGFVSRFESIGDALNTFIVRNNYPWYMTEEEYETIKNPPYSGDTHYTKAEWQALLIWEQEHKYINGWQTFKLSLKYMFKSQMTIEEVHSDFNYNSANPYLKN